MTVSWIACSDPPALLLAWSAHGARGESDVVLRAALAHKPEGAGACHVVVAANAAGHEMLGQGLLNRVSVLLRRFPRYVSDFGRADQPAWRTQWLRPGRLLLLSVAEPWEANLRSGLDAALAQIDARQVPPELPSLHRLAQALRVPAEGDAFLDEAVQYLPALIREMCRSDRGRRTQVSELLGVLNFVPELSAQIARLGDLALDSLQQVSSALDRGDEEDAAYARRCADTSLYLAFELASRNVELDLLPMLDRVLPLALRLPGDWTLWCRGLRDSFLKGLAVVALRPQLMDLVLVSSTEDAIAFRIARIAIEGLPPCPALGIAEAHWLFERLLVMKRRTLIRLAHDLRRTVPRPQVGGGDHADLYIHLTERCLAEPMPEGGQGSAPDGEAWLARCMVLLQTHSCGPSFLRWLQQHHARLGLSRADRDLVAAVGGYDVPYMLALNGRLRATGVAAGLVPPSRYTAVKEYMAGTLQRWAAAPEPARQRSALSDMPLVTVIMTTYAPDVELFAHSLRSIMRQRRATLEIMVIDDASPASVSERLQQCVESMRNESAHELTYTRNAVNQGQYRSRNDAIARANGRYIAIQDDDDLSHPDRIALQLAPMLRDARVMATHAQHLRIAESSRLMADGDRLGQIEGDAPVSFVWRAEVFQAVGGFLPTRTRGDIEFRTRLRRHFGESAVVSMPMPLVLMRGGLGTVSSTQEYFLRSAVSALRFMMDHTQHAGADPASAGRWIPTQLR